MAVSMITVPLEELQVGMVIEEDLVHNSAVIIPRHTTLTQNHLDGIRKFDIPDVMVRDAEGDRIVEERLKAAPTVVQGLGKRLVRAKEYVCIQGEASNEIYILVEGELDVIYTDPALFTDYMDAVDRVPIVEQEGKKISTIKGHMANFGELGALLGEPRTATIVVAVDSVIARIPVVGDSFNNTILRNAKLGLNISITIAKRLKDVNVYVAKYNSILSQVDHMVREFSGIYVAVTGKILKHVISTHDNSLKMIHDECKKSPLYNRLLKYRQQAIDSTSMAGGDDSLQEDDPVFSQGNLVTKKAGEIICYAGEVGERMYILVSGRLGVFVGDKMVASYDKQGEILGEISVLLGYASKGKGFDRRTATVKCISRSRLMCIEAGDLDSLVKTNPALILHMTKKLADRLRGCNKVFIEAQTDVADYMGKLAIEDGSCGAEIDRILDLFTENVNLIELCTDEVKVLKKMHEAIESKYQILNERLGSMSM